MQRAASIASSHRRCRPEASYCDMDRRAAVRVPIRSSCTALLEVPWKLGTPAARSPAATFRTGTYTTWARAAAGCAAKKVLRLAAQAWDDGVHAGTFVGVDSHWSHRETSGVDDSD
jgi:hypothetical protein